MKIAQWPRMVRLDPFAVSPPAAPAPGGRRNIHKCAETYTSAQKHTQALLAIEGEEVCLNLIKFPPYPPLSLIPNPQPILAKTTNETKQRW